MPTTNGSRVDADLILPASVLAALPEATARPLREAMTALDAANEALSDAHEAVASAKDAKADEATAVAQAARSGKAAPKVNPPEWHEERVVALRAEARRAEALARRAAKAVEEAVTAAQPDARPVLAARLREVQDEDVRLHEASKANNAEKHALASLMARIDAAAAQANETDPRHRSALASAVGDHYAKIHSEDPSRFRRSQLRLAWDDLAAAIRGFQAHGYEVDPLKGETHRAALSDVAEAKALQARLDAQTAARFAETVPRRRAEANRRG